MFRLEPRSKASLFWQVATPVLAVIATMIMGGILFAALGFDPVAAIRTIFWDPLFGPAASYSRPQLLVKAGPLILIAQGLAIGFRARIYNIGAEGQLIVGALAGGGVAIATDGSDAAWVVPAMVIAGAIGGALWGAIPALLKTRFNAEETLTTLRGAGIDLEKWLKGFDNVEDSVRHTVEVIRSHPLMPHDVPVHGMVIHPTTGALSVIVDGYAGRTSQAA